MHLKTFAGVALASFLAAVGFSHLVDGAGTQPAYAGEPAAGEAAHVALGTWGWGEAGCDVPGHCATN